MVESNETRAYQIKKPKTDRLPENNPTPQPQRQYTNPNNPNNNNPARTTIRTYTRKDSVRAVNDDRIQEPTLLST
ncbi:hypothetical protein ACTXT7_009104 [Hymenolepis weldensis]